MVCLILEECPDGSMPLRIPEDVERYFEIMTPRGSRPRDVLPGERGVLIGSFGDRFSIMITKEGGLPFDILYMAYDATNPTTVEFERLGPNVVRSVSKLWYLCC